MAGESESDAYLKARRKMTAREGVSSMKEKGKIRRRRRTTNDKRQTAKDGRKTTNDKRRPDRTHDLLEYPKNVDAAQPPRTASTHRALLPHSAESHQRPLSSLGVHRHVAKVALLLVLLLDKVVRRPRRLADRLDQNGIPDAKLDIIVLWSDCIRRQVDQCV